MTGGTRSLVLAGLVLWVGATLVLSTQRWFARRPLTERLRPYSPGGMAAGAHSGLLSIETFRDVVGPLVEPARGTGGSPLRCARGPRHPPGPRPLPARRHRGPGPAARVGDRRVRRRRRHRPRRPTAARRRRCCSSLGAPLLGFLIVEQSVSRASQRWQRHILLELPVVSEQIGMLLSAGFSPRDRHQPGRVSGAPDAAPETSQVVRSRIQQGLGETEALQEWADRSGVPAVERLVQVLALNRQAGDLGRLISEEARAIRRDVQRELVERIERREQQVWIPVTVATLAPGRHLHGRAVRRGHAPLRRVVTPLAHPPTKAYPPTKEGTRWIH